MSSFMAKVGPGLSGKGLLVMPNIFIANWWEPSGIAAWDAFVSNSSGAVQEYFTKWGMDSGQWFTDDGGYHNDWTYRQDFLRRTQAAGKIFVGLTYAPSTDLRSMRYARASFLADWNGGPSALSFEPTTPEQQDPYNSIWTKDLGSPLGAKYKVGLAWRRDFSGGVIVVNPSTSQQTVSLGGTFSTLSGELVTSATLGSADAAGNLLPSGAPSPPPAPPPPAPPPPAPPPPGPASSGPASSTAGQPADEHLATDHRWYAEGGSHGRCQHGRLDGQSYVLRIRVAALRRRRILVRPDSRSNVFRLQGDELRRRLPTQSPGDGNEPGRIGKRPVRSHRCDSGQGQELGPVVADGPLPVSS